MVSFSTYLLPNTKQSIWERSLEMKLEDEIKKNILWTLLLLLLLMSKSLSFHLHNFKNITIRYAVNFNNYFMGMQIAASRFEGKAKSNV
jgi:hypothetical protein